MKKEIKNNLGGPVIPGGVKPVNGSFTQINTIGGTSVVRTNSYANSYSGNGYPVNGNSNMGVNGGGYAMTASQA